jgi:hypothetical protein
MMIKASMLQVIVGPLVNGPDCCNAVGQLSFMDDSCMLRRHNDHFIPMLVGILGEFLTINGDDKLLVACRL